MKKRLFAAFLSAVMTIGAFSASVSAAATTEKLITADISSSTVSLEAELHTSSYELGSWYPNWNWNNVSPISDYIDNKGRYTIAYSDGSNVYISHCTESGSSVRISETVKFAQPMELVGGVIGDDEGNIYVACGQSDEDGTGTICTFAIYKYSSAGKYLGKTEYYPDDTYWSTMLPFEAGNCAMTFQDDLLICSYARKMYSGHQSNAVFCVDTVTMTEDAVYDSYCSHSFNQAVLTLDDSTVVFGDHGDAYPRGFSVNIITDRSSPMYGHYSQGIVPFHFSLAGSSSDMYNVNFTNSRLTGILKLESGIALVGSSGDYETESPQQMFLQIIDPYSGNQVLDGATRTGSSVSPYGGEYTDTGILWLTDYTDGSEVRASAAAALDDSRLLVMWERWDSNDNFVNSYYSIVSSDGKLLADSVPMNKAMLNGAEELEIIGDIAYWTYADGNGKDTTIYRLDTSATVIPRNIKTTAGDGKVTMTWDKVTGATKYAVYMLQNGSYVCKNNAVTGTSYTFAGLTNGTKYSFKVKAYVGGAWKTASGAVSGTPVSSGIPQNIKTTAGDGKVTMTWSAVNGATKYAVYMLQNGSYVCKNNAVTGTSYTFAGLTNGTKYSFKVKAYVNGAWKTASGAVSGTPVFTGIPANIKTSAGDTRVTMTWDKVTGATKYAVYILQNGSYVCKSNAVTGTSYTFSGLTNGTKYSFKVKAYVNGAWKTASGAVSGTPVFTGIPANIKTSAGNGKVTMTWDKVTGATKYAVYMLENGSYVCKSNAVTGTSYTFSGLTNGTRYAFRVKSYVNGAWKVASSTVYGTPVA